MSNKKLAGNTMTARQNLEAWMQENEISHTVDQFIYAVKNNGIYLSKAERAVVTPWIEEINRG